MAARLLAVLLVFGLSACSSADSRPVEFDEMYPDEVGCTVRYGEDTLYVVGPLGPSGSQNIEPNDYTLIRLGRTASDIVLVTEFPDSGSNGGMALNEIPNDGAVVGRGPFRTAANPDTLSPVGEEIPETAWPPVVGPDVASEGRGVHRGTHSEPLLLRPRVQRKTDRRCLKSSSQAW